MAENTSIEWCDATFNPWMGCTKVSPGCDHCYAAVSTPARAMKIGWGAGEQRRRTSDDTWGMPARWNKQHDKFFAAHGRRRRVFCASLADVFDNQVDPQWRLDLLDLIRTTPALDWLLLTKRVGNVRNLLAETLALAQEQMSRMQSEQGLANWLSAWVDGQPPANVWLGATVVNQEEADRDIPKLLVTPAAVRFLSMEPLLGPVSLDCFPIYGEDERQLLHWIIVGGESGTGARPMHPDWARRLRDQCEAAGVPFLFKQWGEWCEAEAISDEDDRKFPERWMRPDGTEPAEGEGVDFFGGDEVVYRAGKKAAGRLLDGVTHDGFPAPSRETESA